MNIKDDTITKKIIKRMSIDVLLLLKNFNSLLFVSNLFSDF